MGQNGAGGHRARHHGEDGEESQVQLYAELGDLARFIDTTMRTLSRFSAPVSSTTEQLPQALTHLTDLRLLTEQGTHEVMKQVEAIQDSRVQTAAALKALAQAVRSGRTATSMEQQVRSIAEALEADDKRLLELVVVFGPFQKQATKQDQGKAADMLKQLEAAKSTAINQDLADEILKQFGFN
jgi:chemotaxis protein CheZ